MQSRRRSLMTSQGMGSRKGKDLWKDSACSSFLEQGRERERSEVGEGKEERGEPGEPGEQVEGNGGRGLGRTDSCRVDGAA